MKKKRTRGRPKGPPTVTITMRVTARHHALWRKRGGVAGFRAWLDEGKVP